MVGTYTYYTQAFACLAKQCKPRRLGVHIKECKYLRLSSGFEWGRKENKSDFYIYISIVFSANNFIPTNDIVKKHS